MKSKIEIRDFLVNSLILIVQTDRLVNRSIFYFISAITGIFYTCFFSALALLFAICMKGLLATLNDERPRWILEESIIGTNPGKFIDFLFLPFASICTNKPITNSYKTFNKPRTKL